MKIKVLVQTTILALLTANHFAMAQAPDADIEAKKILAHYLSAIGGEKALAKIENIVSQSDMSIVEAGVTINREMVQDKSGNLFIKVNSAQTGELFRGFDGDIFWEKNSSAVREIDAESSLAYRNEFAFMRFANWEKILIGSEYLGLDSLDGKLLHCIEVKTIFGVKETWYFNTNDFLLSYTKEQLEMTRGTVTVITKFSDYRLVDGVKHSFVQTVKMGERNRKITFNSIAHNQLIDQKIFSKPLIN